MTGIGFGDIIAELRERLGERAVLVGDAAAERVFADWSEAPAIRPEVVVMPANPGEVAATLELCARFDQPVAVQGGLTGLAGGANPRSGEIVLSLERLCQIEPIDDIGGTVIAGAGVTLQGLQDAVARQNWFFPVDLGARGSAQIGGNAATNAGGNRVLRFGMMRESILGLEVALPDGTLLSMLDTVVKNNAGLDLKQLFIGSEGTLGVITRLSLKLVPAAGASGTALCALPSFEAAATLLREARRCVPGLSSFELMWSGYFDEVLAATGKNSPFASSHPLYVLIETLGADAEAANAGIEPLLENGMLDGVIEDAVLAQSLDQAASLWAIREGVVELLRKFRPNIAFDISVPLAVMDRFVDDVSRELNTTCPSAKHLFFGHLGDGNLHLFSGPYEDEALLLRVEDEVYAAVQKAGGSISAEHGIGIVKRPFLHYSRSPEQLRMMRRLKQALDPQAILNPGRILVDEAGI